MFQFMTGISLVSLAQIKWDHVIIVTDLTTASVIKNATQQACEGIPKCGMFFHIKMA